MSRYRELPVNKAHTVSIADRKSKVDLSMLGKPIQSGASFSEFIQSLPAVLAAKDLGSLVDAVVHAVVKGRAVLWMAGAHVVKTGLGPVLIDLMKRGCVQGLALNGAGVIHDMELAYFGKTSEDVTTELSKGTFGMARETAELMNQASRRAFKDSLGLGEAAGEQIVRDRASHAAISLVGQAYELGIPVTVHVAIGTDIVHQHPDAEGKAIGDASMRDFRIWAELMTGINDGGVVLLLGSAVILPEVFLKALTAARNVAGEIANFTTANFDMIRHYRPSVNVLKRPMQKGEGFSFIGHHEILLPLLAGCLGLKLPLKT